GVGHGADAHEAHRRACAGIVAPDRHLADRAARDALALAAGRGRVDDFGFGLEVLDVIELVHGIERVHRSRLALAPGAMTGIDDQRLAGQAIADISAGASTFHCLPPNTSLPPYSRTGSPRPCASGSPRCLR